jgi:hypothetical protein
LSVAAVELALGVEALDAFVDVGPLVLVDLAVRHFSSWDD